MYYPYFILYMALGLAISLAVFFWALKSGQFNEQQRARYLPLKDLPEPQTAGKSGPGRLEFYSLWILAGVGLAMTAWVLLRALF
ncbi:MAG: cbb3-type cytochrome oxidase assembly protein CcoS [Proteobacteria bacterium]|nr:cbb3-type cytochrome oxidase assembly protein CcoS [Pseudomonadota bacterium]MBU4469786.1 cbb3-type cytochrome oxidase assembly protein CcoS [Pseudomonadota bacterium]MCG2753021.1 cbb3-type cytochrome oxidase assembly protein CcoS [Desulfobacteraceae bacterium]